MFNLIKLYYKYLLSKEVCIILSIILSLYIVAVLYSSGCFEGYKTMELYLLEYQNMFLIDYLLITKAITIILSVLLVIVLYTEQGLNLRVFVIDSFSNKYMFYIVRSIFSLVVTIILTFVGISIFVIIYYFFTPYYFDASLIIDIFIAILIQNIFYVSMTHMIISILPSIIIGFIPIVVFWYYEINFFTITKSQSEIIKFTTEIIPYISLNQDEISMYNDLVIYLVFTLIFQQIYMFISIKKDIN